MKTLLSTSLLLAGIAMQGCSPQMMAQVEKTVGQQMPPADIPVTSEEVAKGLKEALEKGASFAAQKASVQDAFYKNPAIFIPWPPEVKNVEEKLRSIGLNQLCDDFVLSVNRGAEQAAGKATPIFVDAIRKMTISDAMGILKGNNTAATDYLKKQTTESLGIAFRPVIEEALKSVNATKYWTDITTRYNKIPLVKPVNTDLAGYTTEKAINGLFVYVADQEKQIRANPAERTTDLLKRVFRLQDK